MTVHLFEHNEEHDTPDAVFPNNWFSTHYRGEAAGGVQERTLVYYPMKCPNRWCLSFRCLLVMEGLHAGLYSCRWL